MIRRLCFLLLILAPLVLAGCGDKDKNKERDQKDRPKSADKVDKVG